MTDNRITSYVPASSHLKMSCSNSFENSWRTHCSDEAFYFQTHMQSFLTNPTSPQKSDDLTAMHESSNFAANAQVQSFGY